MKKAIIFIVIAALVLTITPTLIFAGNGGAGSQKTTLYNVSGGSSDNVIYGQPYDGHVIIVNPKGKNDLIINGVIRGLDPDSEYFVWVRNLTGYTGDYLFIYAPLGYFKLTSFMTNIEGKGSFNYKIQDSDLPDGTYNIQVAINTEVGSTDQIGKTVAATQWNPGLTIENIE